MKLSYPWLAAGLGLILAIVLMRSGVLSPDGEYALPLLTLLFISEFGCLVTGAGAYIAFRRQFSGQRHWSGWLLIVACGLLCVAFFAVGLIIWQGNIAPAAG